MVRIRRIKELWNAFMFLARGGKFKVFLDFSGVDPRISKLATVYIGSPGRVVDVENVRRNAIASTFHRINDLMPAKPGDPGAFLVKWCKTPQEFDQEKIEQAQRLA
ncbi:MAG: hypothetical protein HQK81_07505 [Desulfovibrionaceae bacterium]|nr:hypothetical protein [Desulfovibrionaceae bacterium]MBF0513896.1 hypothetical protein [Desulfovibrionaceae bacterium]